MLFSKSFTTKRISIDSSPTSFGYSGFQVALTTAAPIRQLDYCWVSQGEHQRSLRCSLAKRRPLAFLGADQGPLHFIFDSDNMFLRLFTQPDGYSNPQVGFAMAFPPATSPSSGPGISFLQGIPAIGSKWDAPELLGPQSQAYSLAGEVHESTVYIFVGETSDLPAP